MLDGQPNEDSQVRLRQHPRAEFQAPTPVPRSPVPLEFPPPGRGASRACPDRGPQSEPGGIYRLVVRQRSLALLPSSITSTTTTIPHLQYCDNYIFTIRLFSLTDGFDNRYSDLLYGLESPTRLHFLVLVAYLFSVLTIEKPNISTFF